MAETLSLLSIISYVAAAVFFVLAIFFWFFFRIPTVIGDLTGRTARKSIAKMRAANEKSGAKVYRESRTNVERGKLTDAMPGTEKQSKKKFIEDDKRPETGLLTENKAGSYETEATGILVDEDETVELASTAKQKVKRTGGKKLVMIEEIMLVHTEEKIS